MKYQYRIFNVILVILFLFNFPKAVFAQKVAYDFIEKHKRVAQIFKQNDSIPISIILGVSMIESAMGTSKNCRLLNNYFGIKGKNNLAKGKTGYRSAYRQYPNATASFKHFVEIVKRKKYYPKLKGNMDYTKWLIAMNNHGYAEAKGKWIHDITRVIKRYHLADLDNEEQYFEDDTIPIWGIDSTMIELQDLDPE